MIRWMSSIKVVVAAHAVWPVLAREGVVKVNVVGAVASPGGGASVALGGLGGVWLVKAYFGSFRILVVR